MGNELPVGSARIGQVYDGIDGTPHIAAMLRRDLEGIHLELSLLSGVTEYHAGWFVSGPVPNFLQFRDTDGSVALAGLRFERRVGSAAWGQARGVLQVNQAVLDANIDNYSSVHGVRSEIVGMAKWTGLSAISENRLRTNEGRLRSFSLTADSKDPIAVSDECPVMLVPYFSIHPDDANGRTVIEEKVLVETSAEPPAAWSQHLRNHQALQDLLSLAFWHPCSLRVTSAQRLDDPWRSIDGDDHGTRWLDAIVPSAARVLAGDDSRLPPNASPLFVFSDIGDAGVARWIREYESLGRPMWPLAALLFAEGTPVQSDLLQVATALEALGHDILGRTGNFVQYLLAVTSSAGKAVSTAICGPNAEDWARDFNAAYKGVKHADNAATHPQQARDMCKAGRLLAQAWLGLHLGAAPHVIAERAELLRHR